jgi:DNA-binding transcriptional LysR family regulator
MYRRSLVEEITLLAVFDTGSFVEAAKRLAISQSTVSRHIASLEHRLGNVQLIERTTRYVQPTSFGSAYASKIRQLLRSIEDIENEMLAENAGPTGLLRLTMPPALALTRLAPVIAELAREHPTIKYEIDISERYLDLMEDAIDLAVRFWTTQRSGVEQVYLGSSPMVWVASPEYVTQIGLPASFEELGKRHLVASDKTFLEGPIADALSAKLGSLPERLDPQILSKHASFTREIVLQGRSIGLLQWLIVAKDVHESRLVPFLLPEAFVDLNAYAAFRMSLKNSPTLQVTIEAFRKELDRYPFDRDLLTNRNLLPAASSSCSGD